MFDIRTDRRRWRLVAAPLGAVALVGLAACGTSADTGTSAASGDSASASASAGAEPTAQNAAGADTAMTAFRTCMANNGVTLPERSGRRRPGMQGGGNGTPPSGAPAPPADGQGGGPAGAGDGGSGRTPGAAPPGVDAATWEAARKACASLAPTPRGGAAPSASAGS